jgi:hypothetical protein
MFDPIPTPMPTRERVVDEQPPGQHVAAAAEQLDCLERLRPGGVGVKGLGA